MRDHFCLLLVPILPRSEKWAKQKRAVARSHPGQHRVRANANTPETMQLTSSIVKEMPTATWLAPTSVYTSAVHLTVLQGGTLDTTAKSASHQQDLGHVLSKTDLFFFV